MVFYDSLVYSCFSRPEVQVDIKPTFHDAGVQCDLLQLSERTQLTANASVQCEIVCPMFTSTPRIDCYSTSESEFPDVSQDTETSSGTYHPSRDIQSSSS